ncbi:putative OPA3-like protein CG13603 [Drosophila kikkawai]|uniref:OPA3-like protein CG13603 n=1 Tax=Drosophila kikkawai TaxID=30033 RepID=A0A6P4J609_DROKI|nr:putative OPA3-like protein CG13603 [Drosophila kikkawai]KAH8337169.1 hypothetical protein KR059_001940 [Drosophila kikkawai]
MVVGTFPIVKLGLLGVRHIAKPISNLIKRRATRNPAFKALVVAPPAQLYNNISVRSRMWMLGMRQPRFVPPLNHAMSIEMGGDLLGEMCIFLIGCLALVAEFSRQNRKEKSKQEENRLVREQLDTKIKNLSEKVASQSQEIRRLKMLVGSQDRSYDWRCS